MNKSIGIFVVNIFFVLGIVFGLGPMAKASGRFDESQLRSLAEDQGYGYKYANLAMLGGLTQDFNDQNSGLPRVEVPEFVGISSSEIKASLQAVGFDIDAAWGDVLSSLDASEKASALASKRLPEKFWVAQRNFQQRLRSALSRLTGNEAIVSRLQKVFEVSGQDKLMVRSTGKEDTRELANAGGNESVVNVAPTLEGVRDALVRVVESYFAEKSLKQRLGLGDRSLFAGECFCPVLVQRMIGERAKQVGMADAGGVVSEGKMLAGEVEPSMSEDVVSRKRRAKKPFEKLSKATAASGSYDGALRKTPAGGAASAAAVEKESRAEDSRQKRRAEDSLEGFAAKRNLSKARAGSGSYGGTLRKTPARQAAWSRMEANSRQKRPAEEPLEGFVAKRNQSEKKFEIPVCGVMFTEEPEGGMSMQEGGHTTGITIIQAALGHNELVVNSKGAVDCYVAQTVAGEAVFYPVIRRKDRRLVPHQDGGLVEEANDPLWALRPALGHAQLTSLKKFADALEQYYGYPMDVEFVVRDGVIWIVQARPIVHNEALKHRRPSYIKNLAELSSAGKVLKGRTIVGFGGQSLIIAHAKSCVISVQIGRALDEYLQREDRDAVVAVLSGTDAPALSHEATTFRSEGKPVLYLPDVSKAEQELEGGNQLIFSPQQHCVVVAQASAAELVEGWCAYPLPRELSYIAKLFDKEQPLDVVGVDIAGVDPRAEVVALFKQLKELCLEPGDKSAMIGVVKRFFGCTKAVFGRMRVRSNEPGMQNDLNRTEHLIGILCSRIAALASEGADTRNMLLAVHYLECALYQQVPGERMLGFLSLARVMRAHKQEPIITEGHALANHLMVQLEKVGSVVVREDIKGAWIRYITDLAKRGDVKTLQSLSKFVLKLEKLKVLPFWIHAVFGQEVDAGTAHNLVKWRQDFQDQEANFGLLDQARVAMDKVVENRFADPKLFEESFKGLQKTQSAVLTTFKVFSRAVSPSPLAMAAVGEVMEQFVNLFDRCVKVMKGSALWHVEAKCNTFQQMLRLYLELLTKIVQDLPDDKKALLEVKPAHWGGPSTTIKDYLAMLDGIMSHDFIQQDLEPSRDFDASPFAVGSGHNFMQDRVLNKQPETGEDAYTIIHQSLLNVCSVVFATELIGMVPIALNECVSAMKAAFPSHDRARMKAPRFIGGSYAADGVTQRFNIPLGSHSLQCSFRYAIKTKKVFIDLQGFGGLPSESYRWSNLAAWAGIFIFMHDGIEVKIHKLGQHAVWVCLQVDASAVDNMESFFTRVPNLIKTGAAEEINFGMDGYQYEARKLTTLWGDFKKYGRFGFFAGRQIFGELVYKDKAYVEAAAAAAEGVKSQDGGIRKAGLELFGELVYKDQAYAEAAAAAAEGVKSGYWGIRKAGLELFRKLFDKGQSFDKAAAAAVEVVKSGDRYIRLVGLELFEKLVDKGQEYVEAAAVASEAVKSQDWDIRQAGLNLYGKLVDKGQEYVEAAAAAAEAVKSQDEFIRKAGEKLFEKLVARGHGFDEAAAAAAVKSQDAFIRRAGLDLYGKLVDKGQSFDKAAAAAAEAVKSQDVYIRQSGLDLYGKLVDKGQCFDVASLAAVEAVKSQEVYIRQNGLNLYGKLVDKGQSFDKAAAAAVEAVKSKYFYNQGVGLELYGKLVDKGQCFDVASLAAVEAVKSEYVVIRVVGLELFGKLFDKGHGFARAAAAAAEAVKSQDVYIRKVGLDLYGKLVDKSQAYADATAAAVEAVNLQNWGIRQLGLYFWRKLFGQGRRFDDAESVKSQDISIQGALELFEKLVNKGQAYVEAAAAAAEAVKSQNEFIRNAGKLLLEKLPK